MIRFIPRSDKKKAKDRMAVFFQSLPPTPTKNLQAYLSDDLSYLILDGVEASKHFRTPNGYCPFICALFSFVPEYISEDNETDDTIQKYTIWKASYRHQNPSFPYEWDLSLLTHSDILDCIRSTVQ